MFLAKNFKCMLKLMLLCVTNGIVIDDIIFLPSVYTVKYWYDKLSIVLFKTKCTILFCFGYCIFGMGTSLLLNEIVKNVPTAKFTF